ncbi:MAG TPA: hypothetical protein VGM84_26160 [Steroidobacteraceae bacterium]
MTNRSGGAFEVVATTQSRWPRQNWILDPVQDTVLVLAAPVIVLGLSIAAFTAFPPSKATALIIGLHVIFTVAHHMPTFIRIYGDVELLRRFRWTLLLGPVVPLALSAGVLAFIACQGYPVEWFLYLYLMLALWDPWHFLRQHYGFMRIYDRHNQAPRRLAARLDLLLCASFFAFVLLASGAWFPEILCDLYTSAHIPILMAVSPQALDVLTSVGEIGAGLSVGVYAGYLYWCRRQGYFVAPAKVLLVLGTFPVLYLTYTPNSLITSLAPGWSFKVGFACIGIVHMTQYLAIVWRYNRSLASQPQRARSGLFRIFHQRGGWLAALAYVAFCLLYGDVITTKFESRWVMSAVLAVGFTSTLLHYYYDGFIWKVRHQQNHQNLGGTESRESWWDRAKPRTAAQVLLRQAAYFGIPMAILTFGATSVWSHRHEGYTDHMYRAQMLQQSGDTRQAEQEARIAFTAMEEQLPYARRIAELLPSSAHEAELAFLIFNDARYAHVVMPAVDGRSVEPEAVSIYQARIGEAIRMLQSALDRGGSLSHAGRENMTAGDADRVIESWSRMVAP